MANSAARIVCLFFILLAAAVPSLGKDYTVGDSSGWTLTGDYKTWASDKSFNVGDNLGKFTLLFLRIYPTTILFYIFFKSLVADILILFFLFFVICSLQVWTWSHR